MANATSNIAPMQVTSGPVQIIQAPVLAAVKLYEGTMACAVTASGFVTNPDSSTTGCVLGVVEAAADNSAVGAADGDVSVNLKTGAFWRRNHTNAVTVAHRGKVCFAADNQTVSSVSTDGPVAGIVLLVDVDNGVLVDIEPGNNYLLSQATLTADLASVTEGKGATLVGFTDSGSKTTAATVDAALDEIYIDLKSAVAAINLPILAFTKADGTALAKYSAANDGTVGIYGDATKVLGVRWNNGTATTETIATTFKVPADCDLTIAPVIKIKCAKVGATVGDAVTFVCGMYSQAEGALYDAGANLGVTTGAMTGDATSKTVQLVAGTLTVFPAVAAGMTLTINPTVAKLQTDDVMIVDAWIEYSRKLRTS